MTNKQKLIEMGFKEVKLPDNQKILVLEYSSFYLQIFFKNDSELPTPKKAVKMIHNEWLDYIAMINAGKDY
jgi:hypothetical protein